MKITKTASSIKISMDRMEWENIGRQKGWLDSSEQIAPPGDAPIDTSPIDPSDNEPHPADVHLDQVNERKLMKEHGEVEPSEVGDPTEDLGGIMGSLFGRPGGGMGVARPRESGVPRVYGPENPPSDGW